MNKNKDKNQGKNQGKNQDKNKNINQNKNQNMNKVIFFAAFLIPVITVLIGMIMGGFAPFGGKDVLTAGGMSEYIPYFHELYDSVHSGNSLLYSLRTGLGYDFTAVWTYYLSDPLNLLVLLFPKAAMLSVFNILYIVKIGLAGLFFSFFLSYRSKKIEADREAMALARADVIEAAAAKRLEKKKKAEQKSGTHKKDFKIGGHEAPNTHFGMFISRLDLTNLAFSVAYALSFYMLGQGLNIIWLSSIALFPLILLGLDLLIQEKKWKLYTIAYLVSFYMNFHMTLVISIVTFFYFILKDYKNLRHFARSLAFKLMGDLLAWGGAMVIILNCVKSNIFRENFSLSFPHGTMSASVFDVFKMQTTGITPSSIWGRTNGVDIYCGAAMLFLLFLYLFNRNIKLQAKLKQAALLLIIFTGFFLTTPNYLLNGLHYYSTGTALFAFGFIAFLLLTGYEALCNMKYAGSLSITLAAVLSMGLVISSLIFAKSYLSMTPFLTTLELLFLFFILSLLWKNDSMTALVFSCSFAVIMIAEACTAYAGQLSEVGKESVAYKDTIDYRLEETENHLHAQNPEARILVYDPEESNSTPLTNTLLGYQYIITDEETETVDSLLEYKETYEGIAVYENPYVVPNGFFLNADILDWEYNEDYPYTAYNLLTEQVFDTEPVFPILQGEFYLSDGFLLNQDLREDDSLSTYRINFVTPSDADIYSNLTHLVHVGFAEAGDTAHFTETISEADMQNKVLESEFAAFNEDALQQLYKALLLNTGRNLEIQIDAPESGYVFLPLSDAGNWYIGKGYNSRTVQLGDEDALLVPVTAGTNTLTLSFRPHNLYLGLLLSIIAIAILCVLSILSRKKKLAGCYDTFRRNKGISRVLAFLQENYVYLAVILIPALIFILKLMFAACAPFGSNSVITSDGYVQTYPFFTQFYNNLRHGDLSLLNHTIGFGMDNFLLLQTTFLNPINWLYLLFPESASLVGFTFVYFIKFSLLGAAMVFYLTHRPHAKNMKKTDVRLIPIALSYNLATFCIAYMCFGFNDMALILPFVLLTMEKLVYEKKLLPYILVMSYTMLTMNYYAFLLCEFLIFYYFLLEHKTVKNFFLNGIRFALSSILCAGIAAVTLIPFYLSTTQSGYHVQDALPGFNLGNTLLRSLQDFQIAHEPVVVSSDGTKANAYCGLLILLFIPVYLANKEIRLSKRLRHAALILLLYFSFGNEFMNYVLHGFHYQSQVPNRFALFLIFILITMLYDCIQTFRNVYSRQALLFFTIFAAIILGITVYNNHSGFTVSAWLTVIFLILYLIIMGIGHLTHGHFKTNPVLLVLLSAELIINSAFSFYGISYVAAIMYDKQNQRIEKLIKEHDLNQELARTVFPGNTMGSNSSAILNMNSSDAFSSIMSAPQQFLVKTWCIYTGINFISYEIGNPLANMILNMQYNFSDSYSFDSASVMEQIDSAGNIELYKNPTALSLGILMEDSLVDWEQAANDIQNPFEYQNSFSQELIAKDIYESVKLEENPENITEHTSYLMLDISSFEDEDSKLVPAKIYIGSDVSGDIYLDWYRYLFYIGTAEEGKQDEFYIDLPKVDEMKEQSYTLSIACFNENNFNELYNYLKPGIMTNIETGSSTISGDVTADSEKMLFLSLPNYKNSWNAYVDGNEVSIQDFLGGMGIPVGPGTHHIELKYSTYGFKPGIIVTSVSILLSAAYIFFHSRYLKKRETGEDETEEHKTNERETDEDE